MRNSSDPSVHKQRELEIMQHVDRLLDDDRLRVDTLQGRRPLPTLGRRISKLDHEVELKKLMAQMNVPDRELQSRMPVGQSLTVTLWRSSWMVLKRNIGRLKVVCLSPSKELLAGEAPKPLNAATVRQTLTQMAQGDPEGYLPTTLVLMSTSGFTLEAHELAERNANRTLILVEPNDAGGWTVHGPSETKALVDLFDPEAEEAKRQRIRDAVEEAKVELLTGSITADRIAAKLQLSLQLVEAELKSYAKESSGVVAKRLEGKVVLFREGNAPAVGPSPIIRSGGSEMPFLNRVKSLFSRKGETEKKIALLAERRAVLSQQREMADEELSTLEQRESSLRQQFKDSSNTTAKRRLTTQLLQLRKDLERRQQLLQMLNQQINVVSTHLHNLELVQQGKVASLPSSEDLANDAAAAEQVLAELQADSEVAAATSALATSMNDEEQALFDELERENAAEQAPEPPIAEAPKKDPIKKSDPARPTENRAAPERTPAIPDPIPNEPEAG